MGNITEDLPQGAFIPLSTADWSPAEWAGVLLGAIMFFFASICMVWLNIKRHVRYIKIMGIPTLNVTFLCMVVYWITLLMACRIIPQVGPMLVCSFWNIWLNEGSIISLFITLIYRFWRLHILLIQHKRADDWFWLWLPALLWSPFLIYAIVSTALQLDGPDLVNGTFYICYINSAESLIHLAHLLFLGAVFLFFAFQLRRVRTRIWREFNQSIITFSVLVGVIIILLSINKLNYHFLSWGRAVYAFIIDFGLMTILFSFIGKPLYDNIFRHEAASLEFENAIRNRRIIVTTESTGSRVTNKLTNFIRSKSSISSPSNQLSDLEKVEGTQPLATTQQVEGVMVVVDTFIRSSQELSRPSLSADV